MSQPTSQDGHHFWSKQTFWSSWTFQKDVISYSKGS
jgi:hypothetical protein